MSADLHERLHTAVGEPGAHPFDLDDAWMRGRRRRTGRRVAGVTASAVVAVAVGMAGLWLADPGAPDVAAPQVGPDPRPPVVRDGWTRVPADGVQPLEEVDDIIDRADEVEEVVRLDGGAEWSWTTRAWDVAADGTVYWVDAQSRHVMARPANGDTRRVTDVPLTLFEDSDGRGVATALQVGPDGRLYLTAPSFESPDLETGQTMVGIIDPAEGLVSLRHNDPTLLYGMMFSGGYGWQQHEQDRWQPIVEMGGQQVLDGGAQRGLEHTGQLAPDGLALELPQPGEPASESSWTLHDRDGSVASFALPWDVPVNGYALPDSNPPSGERLVVIDGQGDATNLSYLVRIDASGVADVVGVDHTIAPGLEGIGNATAVLGEDGHVYWTETTEDGEVLIVRYTRPARDPSR